MVRPTLIAAIILSTLPGAVARADTTTASQGHGSFRPTWTIIGAGAGFGMGVWAGLTAFDDAINSDRKVWTTAIVSAAAGGVLGYLIDRQRAKPRANPSQQPRLFSPEQEAAIGAAAARLGSGELKRWLDDGHAVCSPLDWARGDPELVEGSR